MLSTTTERKKKEGRRPKAGRTKAGEASSEKVSIRSKQKEVDKTGSDKRKCLNQGKSKSADPSEEKLEKRKCRRVLGDLPRWKGGWQKGGERYKRFFQGEKS